MTVRALVVAPEPFFSPRGTPFSVYYRTLVTCELGVEVDLLTYGHGVDIAVEGVRIIRIPRFAFLGDVPVGPSLVKAFLDVFLALWTIALLLRRRYDYVHAHEEAIFFCRLLKPIFRFKLVYDMHSCLPQQLTNFQFTRSRFWIGLFERLERSSLSASDAVITICPDLADYALPLLDEPEKHFLIENSIFEPVRLAAPPLRERSDDVAPEGDDALARDRSSLVVYAGTLEPYQGIDLLLRAFPAVREARPDAFLLVVGGAPAQVKRYTSLARELGLEAHCRFTGHVSQGQAQAWTRRGTVQVSPRSSGTNTPLKIYEQLASGIPIVATRIHSHTQVLDDNVAFLAAPEPEAFAGALLEALGDSEEGKRRVEAARRLYAQKYARPVYEQKMRALLARLA